MLFFPSFLPPFFLHFLDCRSSQLVLFFRANQSAFGSAMYMRVKIKLKVLYRLYVYSSFLPTTPCEISPSKTDKQRISHKGPGVRVPSNNILKAPKLLLKPRFHPIRLRSRNAHDTASSLGKRAETP